MFNCENVDVIGLGGAEVVADEPEEPEDEMPFPVWCRPANEVPTKEFWPKDWLNCDRPLKKEKKKQYIFVIIIICYIFGIWKHLF